MTTCPTNYVDTRGEEGDTRRRHNVQVLIKPLWKLDEVALRGTCENKKVSLTIFEHIASKNFNVNVLI